MMDKTPEYRADRLAYRFRRSGRDGALLREFRNLDESIQVALKGIAGMGADEVPAIGFYQSARSWLLVSSHRIVWSTVGGITSLGLREITDATIDLESLATAGTKDGVSELTLRATGDRSFTIPVEKGQPLSGIWNALKMVASWNS